MSEPLSGRTILLIGGMAIFHFLVGVLAGIGGYLLWKGLGR